MVSNLNRFRLYLHSTAVHIEYRNMDNTRHYLIHRFGLWGPDNRQRTQLLSSQPTKTDKGFKCKFNSSKHLKTTLCWRLTGHIAGGTHWEGGSCACGSFVLFLGTCIKYCIWYLHLVLHLWHSLVSSDVVHLVLGRGALLEIYCKLSSSLLEFNSCLAADSFV